MIEAPPDVSDTEWWHSRFSVTSKFNATFFFSFSSSWHTTIEHFRPLPCYGIPLLLFLPTTMPLTGWGWPYKGLAEGKAQVWIIVLIAMLDDVGEKEGVGVIQSSGRGVVWGKGRLPAGSHSPDIKRPYCTNLILYIQYMSTVLFHVTDYEQSSDKNDINC